MTRRHPEAVPPFRQPPPLPGVPRRCRWCWGAVPRGHRTWCGNACVEEYRDLYDWKHVRANVGRRDLGVCALCGFDTERLKRVLRWVRYHAEHGSSIVHEVENVLGAGLYGEQWEADHIVPRADGGTNEMTNLRTLCCACHRGVTARFAAERARRRREQKAVLFRSATP